MMKTLLIAHRGDTINNQENTIPAFRSALDKGVDGIEFDIQYFNGELVVVHDYLFDRTKSYPTLLEVLKTFSERGRIEIEVKSLDLDFISNLKVLLNKYQNSDIELTTSVFPLTYHLRKTFPLLSIGVIFGVKEFEAWMTTEFIKAKIIKMTNLMEANVAHIPLSIVNKDLIDSCHVQNLKVHSHIYKKSIEDQIKEYKFMTQVNVDQCTFDDISLLEKIKRNPI